MQLSDDLRGDWNLTDKDFEVLELWIEGPISKSKKGFFQDANTDVRVSDLQNPKVVDTVESLAELIWKRTPDENKTDED